MLKIFLKDLLAIYSTDHFYMSMVFLCYYLASLDFIIVTASIMLNLFVLYTSILMHLFLSIYKGESSSLQPESSPSN